MGPISDMISYKIPSEKGPQGSYNDPCNEIISQEVGPVN